MTFSHFHCFECKYTETKLIENFAHIHIQEFKNNNSKFKEITQLGSASTLSGSVHE